MKYDINLLSQKYVEYLEDHEIYQEAPTKTNFQIDAYNDLEYLDCVKVIQENFENVDDLCLYEKFLKGE